MRLTHQRRSTKRDVRNNRIGNERQEVGRPATNKNKTIQQTQHAGTRPVTRDAIAQRWSPLKGWTERKIKKCSLHCWLKSAGTKRLSDRTTSITLCRCCCRINLLQSIFFWAPHFNIELILSVSERYFRRLTDEWLVLKCFNEIETNSYLTEYFILFTILLPFTKRYFLI